MNRFMKQTHLSAYAFIQSDLQKLLLQVPDLPMSSTNENSKRKKKLLHVTTSQHCEEDMTTYMSFDQ